MTVRVALLTIIAMAVVGCSRPEPIASSTSQSRPREAVSNPAAPVAAAPNPLPRVEVQQRQQAPPPPAVEKPRVSAGDLIRTIATANEQIRQTMQTIRQRDIQGLADLGRTSGNDSDQPNHDAVYGAAPTPAPIAVTVRENMKSARRVTEQAIASVRSVECPSDGEALRASYLAALSLSLEDIGAQEQEAEQMLAAMARGDRPTMDTNRARNSASAIDQAVQRAGADLAAYQSAHVTELTPQERSLRF
jgi:hypothetical protein